MELLLSYPSVAKALQLATQAHKGQVDKAGEDYIKHPVAVAQMLDTQELQTVALLHDVIEDTPTTADDLEHEGFSNEVVNAVLCLTHRQDEPRNEYLERVAQNPIAVRVKLADLAHNSDLNRIKYPTEKDYARAERYKQEIAFLQQSQKQ